MGLISLVGRQAGIEIRQVGRLQLVSQTDAGAFLDTCLDGGVIVLGIEAFHLENGRVRPDMAAIADFSQLTNSEESIREARSFIEAVSQPEMFFDFTVSEKEGD